MSSPDDFDAVSNWERDSPGSTPTESDVDTIEDLMRRFTLEYRPDYTLKLRSRVYGVILGADLTHSPAKNTQTGALVAKPANPDALWRRLRLDSAGSVTLRSRKLQWWLLTLDLEGQVNPRLRTSNMSFRVATKWDVYRGQIQNKKRFAMGPGAQGRVHYSVNYNLPEIEGNFKTGGRGTEQQVTADVGYAHGEIPRVELVVWPRLLFHRGPAGKGADPVADLGGLEEATLEPASLATHLSALDEAQALPLAAVPAAVPTEAAPAASLAAAPRGPSAWKEVAAREVATRASWARDALVGWAHAGASAVARATATTPAH